MFMKNMIKLNNKGFSLVETIIVIAIMAILAAALAPQLIKYLEKSRDAADHQVEVTIVDCFNAAIADDAVYKELTDSSVTTFDITFDSNGNPQFPTADFPKLSQELSKSLAQVEKPGASGTTKYTITWGINSHEITGVSASAT